MTVTLQLDEFASTSVPDEYVRVTIPHSDGAITRVYTVSDCRYVEGKVQVDLDIVLHENGFGADWASTCVPGDRVELSEARAMFRPPVAASAFTLLADHTGLPALARILRSLEPEQSARAVVVITDNSDQIALPSPADASVEWVVAKDLTDVGPRLVDMAKRLFTKPVPDHYVWAVGEASACRTIRKHLRREVGWSHDWLLTCGYWQVDAAVKAARYTEVAATVEVESQRLRSLHRDEGDYLDALEDLYDRVGL